MFEGLEIHKETFFGFHFWLKEHLQYLLNLSKRDYIYFSYIFQKGGANGPHTPKQGVYEAMSADKAITTQF